MRILGLSFLLALALALTGCEALSGCWGGDGAVPPEPTGAAPEIRLPITVGLAFAWRRTGRPGAPVRD